MRYSIILLLVFFFSACSDQPVDLEEADCESEKSEEVLDETEVTGSVNQFGYTLFNRTIEADSEVNVMISPLSVFMALSMVLNGASGETAEELKSSLNLTAAEISSINRSLKEMMNLLEDSDPAVQLAIGNSVWHRRDLNVKSDFKETLLEYYGAESESVDFDAPETVQAINDWVSRITEGTIDEIVSDIPDEMVMYLINAVYFKGDWTTPFDKQRTAPANFRTGSGETISVEMMRIEESFKHFFSDTVRLIELPYSDGQFVMTVLMPANELMPIDQFVEEFFTLDNFSEWRENLQERNLNLQLPRFQMDYEVTFNNILKSMGVEQLFNPSQADLSGIADVSPQRLFVSEVKHKSYISVDEEGTEAAAATGVGVGVTSMPPQFLVNRPFLFVISDKESGANLFMGRVLNPEP